MLAQFSEWCGRRSCERDPQLEDSRKLGLGNKPAERDRQGRPHVFVGAALPVPRMLNTPQSAVVCGSSRP